MSRRNAAKVKIIGSYLSPYVRKVLVCLDLKELSYEIDPIVPYFGGPEFERLSPLRRIPVLLDGDVAVADSTVICEYLEDAHPETPLMPSSAANRAQARWFEEFADSRLGEVFIWHLYNQRVIRRYVWGLPPDDAVLTKAIDEEIPHVMQYLETQLPDQGFLFGDISIADVAIASFFRNAAFARYDFDVERWPVAMRFVDAVLAIPAFRKLSVFEAVCMRVPIEQHRDALRAAGAPVAEHTFGTAKPLPGILST